MAEGQQPLSKGLREAICLDQPVEDQMPEGLGQEFLEHLAPQGQREELPTREEEPVAHQRVEATDDCAGDRIS